MNNDTQKLVGEQFGIEKYNIVSSIGKKVKYEMKVDKGLKKWIQNLAEKFKESTADFTIQVGFAYILNHYWRMENEGN